MSYLFEFYGMYILGAAIIIELVLLAIIIWCFLHEEKLVAFEDRIICYVRRRCRQLKIRMYSTVRKLFIKTYGAYRRFMLRRCRKILLGFGMKVGKVKSESVALLSERGFVSESGYIRSEVCDEVLPW